MSSDNEACLLKSPTARPGIGQANGRKAPAVTQIQI
jgi:hypothetical protein